LAFSLICGFGAAWLAGKLWSWLDRVGRVLLARQRRD
jgi:hypothetical protein